MIDPVACAQGTPAPSLPDVAQRMAHVIGKQVTMTSYDTIRADWRSRDGPRKRSLDPIAVKSSDLERSTGKHLAGFWYD